MTTNLLAGHRAILIDSCVWIYYLKDHPKYANAIEALLTECQDWGVRLPGSELTLLEIAGGPLRRGQDRIAAEYRICEW